MGIKSFFARISRFALLALLAPVALLSPTGCEDPNAVAAGAGESAARLESFEIRVGERVRDWCARVESENASVDALLGAAGSDSPAAGPGQSPLMKAQTQPGDGRTETASRSETPADRIEDSLTCDAVRRVAGTLRLPGERFAFLPAPVDRLNRFEGLFVPGRYTRESGESVDDLIRRLLEATGRRLRRGGISVADYNIPGLEFNAYRQMTLASIVEKEAASNRGYEGVAAVFLNRLRENEVLGSCPTVEYALGYHRPFLLFKDLELKSPYNAYKRRGLPPTPIAFFSDEAFAAVREPIDSAAYFFVYDWTTGDLIFADDYGAHKRNARGARERFIAKFGKETLYKKYDGLFYEMPAQ
ncbi:MAG: endolytic transglycosylase MltG [Leptospirales bacterium]